MFALHMVHGMRPDDFQENASFEKLDSFKLDTSNIYIVEFLLIVGMGILHWFAGS